MRQSPNSQTFYINDFGERTTIGSNIFDCKLSNNIKNITNLINLENFLIKLFKGLPLTINDFALSTPELQILVEILIRKNKNKSQSK